jgi:hypothetical protein
MKFLYNSRGQSVNIDVDTSLTVGALKDQLQDLTGVTPQFQEVLHFFLSCVMSLFIYFGS